MARLGDVFWLTSEDSGLEHLYVVASDPGKNPQEVVLVSFTTRDIGVDESCIVYEGDHPRVTHESCVDYRRAKILSEAQIDRAVTSGQVRSVEPVSEEMLQAIWRGASETRFLPSRCDRILRQQELIP